MALRAYKDNADGYYQVDLPIGAPDPDWTIGMTPCAVIAPIITIQQQKDAISNAIQSMLDAKAQSLRYDSILSARSYAGYVNPFQAEAIKLADWSANCWATAGSIEAQVNTGTISMPTVDQALAMMPAYV